jgi:RimJ/RimL family protein N-acetyltransferase
MAWRSWCSIAGAWQVRGYSMFSVIEKQTGRWIGRIGPWMPEGWPGTEVGWGLVRDAHRKGYAREAAVAAIDFAFDVLGFETVIHCIDPGNAPSIALAENLGSTRLRTGVQAPPPIETLWDVYGQSRAQWRTSST